MVHRAASEIRAALRGAGSPICITPCRRPIILTRQSIGSDSPAARICQKPKGARPLSLPPIMDGAPSLANWSGSEIVLTCDTCGRREVFVVAELRLRLGSDMLMTNVRVALSADCPRRLAASVYDQCGALLEVPG